MALRVKIVYSNAMNTIKYTQLQQDELLKREESHFFDFKRVGLSIPKFERVAIAFANADGGEICLGVDDKPNIDPSQRMFGFMDQESANDYLAALDRLKPVVEGIDCEFLILPASPEQLILKVSVPKSKAVHFTSADLCFRRLGAQCLSVKGEAVQRLMFAKGQQSYEDTPCDTVRTKDIEEGEYIHDYLKHVPTAQPIESFLRKQRLIVQDEQNHFRGPRVLAACVLALDDLPQSALNTKCAIKIARIESSRDEYRREDLSGDPETIEGPTAVIIQRAVGRLIEIMQSATFKSGGEYKALRYPKEAVHEIIANAVLHRDYSIKDDILIYVYDNRIEVMSPGKLPGHMTIENILSERFSRNPKIVRTVNRLPEPPNRDIGEGLNTAFEMMRKAKLKDPEIYENENSVLVILRHEGIASPEKRIIEYCLKHTTIKNSEARDVTGNGSENAVKRLFGKMMTEGILEPANPDAARTLRKYKLKDGWQGNFEM